MPLDGLKQDANTKKSSGRSDSLISFIWMWRIKKKKRNGEETIYSTKVNYSFGAVFQLNGFLGIQFHAKKHA